MISTAADPVANLLARLEARKTGPNQWQAICPAHNDDRASLCVGRGDDGRALVHCQAGCTRADVLRAVGLTDRDLFVADATPRPAKATPRPPKPDAAPRPAKAALGPIVAEYNYRDAAGDLLYQATRHDPKDFRQRRPDDNGGWIWSLGDTPRVLYRLPELIAADATAWAFVVEGEKDADNLAALGLAATCNPGGAGKWKHLSDDAALHGRHVAIIPDADEPGRRHAQDVASRLYGKAADVRILELPGDGKDASDWLEAQDGRSPEELAAALIGMATEATPWTPAAAVEPVDRPEPTPTPAPGRGFPLTDYGNAQRLVALHGEDIRYVHTWKAWLVWDGRRWARDESGEILRRMKRTVRTIHAEAAGEADDTRRREVSNWARKSESAAAIGSAIKLGESEAAVSLTADMLDCNDWLFNCANGTIELGTGFLRPHARADLITRLSPVHYDPAATLPLWDTFLATVTGGDAELAAFLQRAIGYSLTGNVDEEAFFVMHGPAASGKSTFAEAGKAALGDYAAVADFETFLSRSQAGGARNDIARLIGKRFVLSIEVEAGRQLAEALVKTVTGGDTVSARYLYQEAFEFRPAFKLWLVCNDAPHVAHDDLGMRRRMKVVPFTHSIPPEERDPAVKATLRDPALGGPAILAWAVQGCLAWQASGLGDAAVVDTATEAYWKDQDPLREFLADCCALSSTFSVGKGELRDAYENWARANGVDALNGSPWTKALEGVGCKDGWAGSKRVWRGIGLALATNVAQPRFQETSSRERSIESL